MNNTDNFTAYPNILLERIISSNCTCMEKDIFHLIVRKTYGFNVQESELSYNYIAQSTGYGRRKVIDAINRLYCKNMIAKRKSGSRNMYRINECWEQWEEFQASALQGTSNASEGSDRQGTILVPYRTPEVVPYRAPNKEIYKKIYKEKGQSPQNVPAYVKNNPFLQHDQNEYDYDAIEKELRGK